MDEINLLLKSHKTGFLNLPNLYNIENEKHLSTSMVKPTLLS